MKLELLSIIFYWLLIISGGAGAALLLNKKFEQVLPFTMIAEVMFMFAAGMCGSLQSGFFLVCVLSAGIFFYGIYTKGIKTTKERAWLITVWNHILTPGFFVFSILYFIHALSVFRMLPHGWDEFSFWAVAVKKMCFLNKFYCHPDAALGDFNEYPPGMQLLEYIAVRTAGKFADWKIYSAYGTYLTALFTFFLEKYEWKKKNIIPVILSTAALVTSGCLFYHIYDTVTVDFALGTTFAFGIALCLLCSSRHKYDTVSYCAVALTASMLVLIKSVGKLFAGLLVLSWVVLAARKGRNKKRQLARLPVLALPFFVSMLWEWKYKSYGRTPSFDTGKYNIGEFFRIITGRGSYGYRTEIKDKFIQFIIYEKAEFGWISVTNLMFVVLAVYLMFLLFFYLRQRGIRLDASVPAVFFSGIFLYWAGLMMSYMYTFSEREGIRLASMQRYLNIYNCAAGMLFVFLIVYYCGIAESVRIPFCAAMLICVTVSKTDVWELVSRNYAHESQSSTQHFRDFKYAFDLDGTAGVAGERGTIVLVHQEGYPHVPINGFSYFVYPYYKVPWECKYGSMPTFDGDAYTRILTAEEFADHIEGLGADYIAIDDLNDDFIEQYSVLFDQKLQNGQVYRVARHGYYELVK